MAEGEEDTKKAVTSPLVSHFIKKAFVLFGTPLSKIEKFESNFATADESSFECFSSFITDPDMAVIFLLPTTDGFTVTRETSSLFTAKKKIIAIHRVHNDSGNKHISDHHSVVHMDKGFVFMELSIKQLISNFNALLSGVYYHVVSNPLNQSGWSEILSQDLVNRFYSFVTNVELVSGQYNGLTVLPLPGRTQKNCDVVRTANDVDELALLESKERLHSIESAIIVWSKQINNVLKENNAQSVATETPENTLAFWKKRSDNLSLISAQISSTPIQEILAELEENNSDYFNPFNVIISSMETQKAEANDLSAHFESTLREPIDKLSADTLDVENNLIPLYDTIFEAILEIWTNCKYITSNHIVILLVQLCNAIVSQGIKYCNGPAVFQWIAGEETNEAISAIDLCLNLCNTFKDKFIRYKDQVESIDSSHGWRLQTQFVFATLDKYRDRLRDVRSMCLTVVDYMKLDKINVGGNHGKHLSSLVESVLSDVKLLIEKFSSVEYDILDIRLDAQSTTTRTTSSSEDNNENEESSEWGTEFETDYRKFKSNIAQIDKRISSVIATGFTDLNTLSSKCRLFEVFEPLFNRSVILDQVESQFDTLVVLLHEEIKTIQEEFKMNKDHSVNSDIQSDKQSIIYSNMPPVAGSIYWCRSLRNRLLESSDRVIYFADQYISSGEKPDEYRDVLKLRSSLIKYFDDFENTLFDHWKNNAVSEALTKMGKKLLARNEQTGLLRVNFDPALVRLLREVKYLIILDIDIPEDAMALYNKTSIFREWNGILDVIVTKYNYVLTDLLPVEEPLLTDRIMKMDTALSKGIKEVKWEEEPETIVEFLNSSLEIVSDVASVVDSIKNNLKKISAILVKWSSSSILERRPKPVSPDEFDGQHKASVGVRLHQLTEDGKEIHKLIKESSEALRVSKQSATWKTYLDFVSNIIIEGFVSAITASLNYLIEIIDPISIMKLDLAPIFDINLELIEGEIRLDPPFDGDKVCIKSYVSSWIKDFFVMATCVARVDSGTGDYLNETKEHFQIQALLSKVSKMLNKTKQKVKEYTDHFNRHRRLWLDNVDEAFDDFLLNTDPKDLVTLPETENGQTFRDIMSLIKIDFGPAIPSLESFDVEILKFVKLKNEINEMSTSVDIHWLRLNAHSAKVSLTNYSTQWKDKYTSFLTEYISKRVTDLHSFIQLVSTDLSSKSPVDEPDNSQLLYQTMTHIRDVKLSVNAMKLLERPLIDLTLLARKHHAPVDEEIQTKLEQIPSLWDSVVSLVLDVKEVILPLQSKEMLSIRKKIDDFGSSVQGFRSEFMEKCPFSVEDKPNADDAYSILDTYYLKCIEISQEAADYNNLELLFDMAPSGYRQLKECMDDLILLKQLWDVIVVVTSSFIAWNNTLWEKIDTDDLIVKVKDITTQVKNMPKEMRPWNLYNWLLDEVKNMSTVLPLISDLHSDTMRERHWNQLMSVTGKSFNKGPDFCFKNLLDLHLHKFADEVSEIVDQSAKEAKIEKKLGVISATWTKLDLTFDRTREDCPLLTALGEVIETLEGHSLEIMGMASQGRFIEFCQSTVDLWTKNLGMVDTVLNIWIKVQRNWCRLEPIFMLSDDIRSQLPEESKQFETLDSEFRDLMLDAAQNTNAVEICVQEGRVEVLNRLHEGIECCEKALNDYLEQKKKAFPRFYFCSNQALLDILSNGNKPLKVAEYLGDCFDGVRTLNFEKDPNGKIGSGIYSKDTEYVPFHQDVVLEGAVETYLSNLEHHIRQQLRDILEQSRNSADNWEMDKSREYWLEDYCAQLALVSTQMVWTEETARAFDEIEAGNETAMKDYKRICEDRIAKLIKRVQQPLSADLRCKIITVITIDVHARDVIEKFIASRIFDSSAFQWQSQLRFYFQNKPPGSALTSFTPDDMKTCVIRICDWTTIYLYEYVGNCGRLVITPLTDRCYITLTQALNLVMGGAPAGPAGTGKTETTKDLARAISVPIMVFNCSDQMSYLTMAQIFMGLSQVGAWGCFDEFNRISIEVLSVVSTQVKTILDAIKEGLHNFLFMDDEIKLVPTCGFFITMNPGYAGRTELPENLKALFRSCAMVTPDLVFICENMLMSEGFLVARSLARKFVCLYSLCKELLSKQMHYDWGLRAVKSLLRQAGTLKRADPDMDEYPILMRALRDFNTPKIVTEDMPIFLRLIQDLFPSITAETKQDPDFKKVVVDVATRRKLQPDEGFVTKVIGLKDILQVRHCCFIIGPTGSSKTEVWKCLHESLAEIGEAGQSETLNPKAVTSDELYGIMTKNNEWNDGAIAVIMRNMSKEINGYKSSHIHKWIILDGDIDAEWIESMNTVMDDNKVLTLVSNERIPFTPTMRMLLEIQDMKHASPATVSRGGVLFINDTDVGWKPFVESWREKLPDQQTQSSTFYLLFSSLFESNLEYIRKSFEFSCPMVDIAWVQSICCIVDALLLDNSRENMEYLRKANIDEQKLIYESYFIFAMMWAIGGAVADDKVTNHRRYFNSWIRTISKNVKIPDAGDPMDYRYEPAKGGWVLWSDYVVEYTPVTDRMYQNVIVSNVELERLKYVLHLHTGRKKPVLFCGVAGTAKTTIVRDYLAELPESEYLSAKINLNSYTDSRSLQSIMESYLDKRTGRSYGAPGNCKCVYFLDDINMPYVDKYDTQSAIMLLNQIVSTGTVFDRHHLEEKKELKDLLYVACMNPKSGSFLINLRLQRHFTVLTTFVPTSDLITQIYSKILNHHLLPFDDAIKNLSGGLISGTIDILNNILNQPCFLPSAKKFHYQFNLKDVANIFQGVLLTKAPMFKNDSVKFVREWLHECERTFLDRLIDKSDQEQMISIFQTVSKKHFANIDQAAIFAPENIFTSFVSVHGGNEKMYIPVKDLASLKDVLEDKLREYNETFAAMDLVLFDDAIEHITRICRIIDLPCGHALLVGVGGSGKQSLSRLACFINNMDVITILVNQSYGINELKVDLQEMYKKAAVKPGSPIAFLLTDGQIADERFLVFLNDLLASGNIPDLFTREEYDGMLGAVRNQAKAAGFPDDRKSLFQFFIDKVRQNLHVIFCHSPVGDTFRIRGRKFPALISCMTVDEFHPWPKSALENVSGRFLSDIPLPESVTTNQLSTLMSDVHLSIDEANADYLKYEGRYNYTTPKSFLELISFYKTLLSTKRADVEVSAERLDKGLTIMEQVQEKVAGLKEDLNVKMVQVKEKKDAADVLIKDVTAATEVATKEKAIANVEAEKTNALAAEASEIKAVADGELQEAMPAMEAAKAAVDCLTKPAIQELKSLGKPPAECVEVTKAVLILLKNEKKNLDWKSAQKMMNNPPQFLEEVKQFNANEIPQWVLDMVAPILAQPFFNEKVMMGKSQAAAYMCNWVVNIVKYNQIYQKVAPLMEKVAEATANKEEAEASLAIVMERVREIEEKVAELETTLSGAVTEKEAVEAEANACLTKLELAERLVNGLADEYKRWTATVQSLKTQDTTLIGDCLLASSFVGYISPFSSVFRDRLWRDKWLEDMKTNQLPHTDGIDPLNVLASEADIAKWKNEGLPADRKSIENASVIVSCARWPLMIDPQLQGVKWIKQRLGDDLTTLQLTQANWLQKVVFAIQMGGKLLIEAVGEEIDAILEPLLSRSTIRRGKSLVIKIGDEEIDYDPKFELILQTKFSNPHYRPEIAAQCTIINFIVTPSGLEDQILAMVVNVEKPELEQQKQELVRKQNEFKVTLAQLEDDLLAQLSCADPATILDNTSLVEGLEKTKFTANEISEQVKLAQETEEQINISREQYRAVAADGSMIFFLIIQLNMIEHMYQYSLDSFVNFVYKAIDKAIEAEDVNERVANLTVSIRLTIFKWVNRGLFERHKLIFCSLLSFGLLQRGLLPNESYNAQHLDFLLRSPLKIMEDNPLIDWLPNACWGKVNSLVNIEGFETFAQNMEKDAPNRFKEWFNEISPEDSRLPLDWKKLDNTPLQKLMVLRCLRPDRMTAALSKWILAQVPNGRDYVECDGSSSFYEILSSTFDDSSSVTPIFFILSPGADPVKEVESLGKKLINLTRNVNYHNVAMGQGQDVVAMAKLDLAHKEGHWVMLQNIHLMPKWCTDLEKKLDNFAIEGSHSNFRCFLSADPAKGIPIGILERSLKLTNEPPQGLHANLRRAFAFFSREDFEERDSKVKSILFGLCHFHAVMLERKKFGPMGYNMSYPFSIGDLRDSASVLYNYLENANAVRVPWDDLRYIFGEIMYGGHIVDDWDRKLCKTYLEHFMVEELLDETELIPFNEVSKISYKSPNPNSHDKYLEHIEIMPSEHPAFFGLHTNAEIGFRTMQCNLVFDTLTLLQPKGSGGGEGDDDIGASPMQMAENLCNDILDEIRDIKYPVDDISRSLPDEEKGPYQYVFLQECEYMNQLVGEMIRSLSELQLGFKGELTMSESMENLVNALFLGKIPDRWAKLAFPSTRPLLSWLGNLKDRCTQLDEWITDPTSVPKVVDLSKLFNPQSFLTAVKQLCCQNQNLELDKLQVFTEVTKRDSKSIDAAAREGAYVTGMFLEGARWDVNANCLDDSRPREMFFQMPVINCKAGMAAGDDAQLKNVYICPTYCTPNRRPHFVFSAQLRTKQNPAKWVLGGVAMILDVGTGV